MRKGPALGAATESSMKEVARERIENLDAEGILENGNESKPASKS